MNLPTSQTKLGIDDLSPLLPAIPAFASIGVGRTRAYEFLNSGQIAAVKLGKSTMLRRADFDAFIQSLPAYRSEAA